MATAVRKGEKDTQIVKKKSKDDPNMCEIDKLTKRLKRMTSDNLDDLCCKLSTTQATGFNRICKVLHLQLERSWLSMIVAIFGLGFESDAHINITWVMCNSSSNSPITLKSCWDFDRLCLNYIICSHPFQFLRVHQSNPKQGPCSSPGASRWPVLWGGWQYVAPHLPGRSMSSWPHLAAQWRHPKRRSRDCNLGKWIVTCFCFFNSFLMDLWWSCSGPTGLTISCSTPLSLGLSSYWYLITYVYIYTFTSNEQFYN